MTLSRPVLIGGAAVLVVAALILLWPARPVSPTEQVKRQVIQCVRAAEEKDLGTIMEQISLKFRMQDGIDRDELRQLLAGRLLTQQWIRVFLIQLSTVDASGGGVDVEAKIIYGNSPAKTLPELAAHSSLEAYDIKAHFQRESGAWHAVSAQVQPISAQDLVSLTP